MRTWITWEKNHNGHHYVHHHNRRNYRHDDGHTCRYQRQDSSKRLIRKNRKSPGAERMERPGTSFHTKQQHYMKTQFDQFLTRHRAYRAFYRNLKINGHTTADVNEILRKMPGQVISAFFLWDMTVEATRVSTYWIDLHNIWNKHIKKIQKQRALHENS
jgi:CRISPR/Cas system CSM-associated protein Csm5 (group 7 of RAMP superfamily)